ncbi:MAG: hypothetical protein E6Q97_17890 [Desulfurellales bacterium]|nr:MAG: hypothetical protein E6Q97_17890 [Desulfurellales bacterium]
MQYWNALKIIQQVAAELGLPQPVALPALGDVQSNQLVALLNSAGNELLMYYPWEQFVKHWNFVTVDGRESYAVPMDLAYFVDQTQWDSTNRKPLLGPKSPQEWAWLKSGTVATAPRMRYRIADNKLKLLPVPGATPLAIDMEYMSCNWVAPVDELGTQNMINIGTDIALYHPWMLVKFIKMKFYELKGFDTTSVRADFLRLFNSLTGKDKGGAKLSLSPQFPPMFIGPWSVPDGSWDVGVAP